MEIHTIWVYGDMKAAEAKTTGASKITSHLLLLYHRAEVFEMGAWHFPQWLILKISTTTITVYE